MKASHIVLSLFLIIFGAVFGYLVLSGLLFWGYVLPFILYIPTLALGCALPLYGGIALLVDDIKNSRSGE